MRSSPSNVPPRPQIALPYPAQPSARSVIVFYGPALTSSLRQIEASLVPFNRLITFRETRFHSPSTITGDEGFPVKTSFPNSITKSSATCRSTTSYVMASLIRSFPLKRKDIPPDTPGKRLFSSESPPSTDGAVWPAFCNRELPDAKNGRFEQRFANTRSLIGDSQKMADFLTLPVHKSAPRQDDVKRPFLSTSHLHHS